MVTYREKRNGCVSFLLLIVVAVAIALVLRFFVFEFAEVKGESSEPTLSTGEIVLVEKVSYKFGPPNRGDMIVCNMPGIQDYPVIKRVMGLPGETVSIAGGKFYINGELMENDIFTGVMQSDMAPVNIPGQSVFVMGDNRNYSADSRSDNGGCVPFDNIIGKAVLILWPLDNLGPIPGLPGT